MCERKRSEGENTMKRGGKEGGGGHGGELWTEENVAFVQKAPRRGGIWSRLGAWNR